MYRIVFGVRRALPTEVGLDGTYSTRDRAFKAGEACWKQNTDDICGFMVYKTKENEDTKDIIKRILLLYPKVFPKSTIHNSWYHDLTQALKECPAHYLLDVYDILRESRAT